MTLEDRGRLERVVMKWIQSQCSPVTWQNVIDTLLSMELKTTAGRVQDCLKHQQRIWVDKHSDDATWVDEKQGK